ncbi:invasion associated locus B family protein [Mesorhizobium sp. SB112]|uniref:invasion associated locus B family protein n=1 Tax=Mesorhizobium sp. SB112 TaxID=3151853 RepID=UPI003267B0DB
MPGPDPERARPWLCAFSQPQSNAKGQNVLSVELQPAGDATSGVLVLPFGLAVTQGITLQVDEAESRTPCPFFTCAGSQLIVTGEPLTEAKFAPSR